MRESITWVGLDIAKKEHAVAVLAPGSDVPREGRVVNEPKALRRWARKVVREAGGGEVRVCYEAGVCGFALARQLELSAEGLVCEVIAPGLVPMRPGDRVKTDRRDAKKLVRLYRAGELRAVEPPTEVEEGVRELTRHRARVAKDLRRQKQRVQMLCLRRGRVYRGRNWSVGYRRWVRELAWESPEDRFVLEDLLDQVEQYEQRVRQVDAEIARVADREVYREPVGWLRCYHGIETYSALALVVELYRIERFGHPREVMMFLGLTPSENSTGEQQRRGPITKAGNAHVRRILVEIAKNLRHPPRRNRRLRERREGQPAWAVALAEKAHRRLYERHTNLRRRGLLANKVSVALARELAGFVWATLTEGAHRTAAPPRTPAATV